MPIFIISNNYQWLSTIISQHFFFRFCQSWYFSPTLLLCLYSLLFLSPLLILILFLNLFHHVEAYICISYVVSSICASFDIIFGLLAVLLFIYLLISAVIIKATPSLALSVTIPEYLRTHSSLQFLFFHFINFLIHSGN